MDASMMMDLAGKNVLVMGLGRFGGGVGVTRFLAARGANVTVTDQAEAEKLKESVAQLDGLDVTFHLGGHVEEDFASHDMIVVNPAVRRNSPWLEIARKNNVLLTSEMSLFFMHCPAKIVGITGSNGKSTTTSMIAHVLELAGKVWLGGNIGQINLLSQVDSIQADDIVVVELSSFQLHDLARFEMSPHIAVVTNVSPNHLDWHGTMDEYVKDKQAIVRYQKEGDIAVLNHQDLSLADWQALTKANVVWYPEEHTGPIQLTMPGKHNQVNAAAALVVAKLYGIERVDAAAKLGTYKGLPHRLELVGQVDQVRYYNDSIATTPDSVIAAIEAFEEEKVLIMGGYDKKIPFDALAEKVAGAVHSVVLLGQVQQVLYETIEAAKTKRNVDRPKCVLVDSFEKAVNMARVHAQPGMVVLMSPACASYDMFTNFQERGQRFVELVLAME